MEPGSRAKVFHGNLYIKVFFSIPLVQPFYALTILSLAILLYCIKVYNPGFGEPSCKHLDGFWMAGEIKELVA